MTGFLVRCTSEEMKSESFSQEFIKCCVLPEFLQSIENKFDVRGEADFEIHLNGGGL
jgi:hypothetical protein